MLVEKIDSPRAGGRRAGEAACLSIVGIGAGPNCDWSADFHQDNLDSRLSASLAIPENA